MNKKEQQEFNHTVVATLDELVEAVHVLAQGRRVTDKELNPLYKKLARLGGLIQP